MPDSTLFEDMKARRLNAITQRIGFALWQIQELEEVVMLYLLMRKTAQQNVDLPAYEKLIKKVRGRPFGATLHEITKAKLFGSELQDSFQSLLNERNWLVHRSRRDSRPSVKSDELTLKLIERVDAIADTALELLREIGELTEDFSAELGISNTQV